MDRIGSHQIATAGAPRSEITITDTGRQRFPFFLVSLVATAFLLVFCHPIKADEPFTRFMTRLTEERLFDLAIVYLDQQSSIGTLNETQVAAIPLEKALLFQQSSIYQRTEEARNERIEQADAAFKEFLDKNPTHPRRGEAKLGVGNLLLSRGEKSFDAGMKEPVDAEKLKVAADFFKRSQDFFNASVTELTPILNELQGAKIASDDAELIARRKQLRGEYRQAQLLAVYAQKRAADCLPTDSAERKSEIETVEKNFTAIYLKEKDLVGIRNYALFYRGQAQASIGKINEALDSFQRIADDENSADLLRGLKTRALTELIKILVAPAQSRFDDAIAMGEPWADAILPAEAQDADWLEFQIVLSQARILAAKKLRETDGGATATKNLEDKARRTLQSAVRINGSHQDRARALLTEIGVEAITPVADNKPIKTFAEALAAAKTKLSDLESVGLTVEILRQQIAETSDASEKSKLEAQINSTQTESNAGLKEVSDLLAKALALYGPEDNRSQLQEARYLLSYTLLRQDRLYEAAATAGFTTRSSAGETWGLQSGMVCLNAYQRMLTNADQATKDFVFVQLQSLAEYLLKTWPAADESQQAANILVQLTLIGGDLEKAKNYVGMVPTTTPSGGKLRRQLGLSLWDDYNKRVRAAGDNAAG